MDLILWRHAEAFDAEPGEDDLLRKLTPRGELHARRVARWLNQRLPERTKVLSSPAMRTEQTAQALERRYKINPLLAPDANVETFMDSLDWPNGKTPILLVGHQPFLGQVIARLMNENSAPFAVRKGAAWWLRHRKRDEIAQTIIFSVVSPENA